MREKTHAHRKMSDNVPEETKNERLKELIEVFRRNQLVRSNMEIGSRQLVLVDSQGKKQHQWKGKSDNFKTVVFEDLNGEVLAGDWVEVEITSANPNTLFGTKIRKTERMRDFKNHKFC